MYSTPLYVQNALINWNGSAMPLAVQMKDNVYCCRKTQFERSYENNIRVWQIFALVSFGTNRLLNWCEVNHVYADVI